MYITDYSRNIVRDKGNTRRDIGGFPKSGVSVNCTSNTLDNCESESESLRLNFASNKVRDDGQCVIG
jgi:hypothetical protein